MCYLLEISLFPHLPLLHTYSAGRIQLSSSTHSFLLASESSRPEEWQPTGGIDVKGKGHMLTFLYRNQEEEEEEEAPLTASSLRLGGRTASPVPAETLYPLHPMPKEHPSATGVQSPPPHHDHRGHPPQQPPAGNNSSALPQLMTINSTYLRLCSASGTCGNAIMQGSFAASLLPASRATTPRLAAELIVLGSGASVPMADQHSAAANAHCLTTSMDLDLHRQTELQLSAAANEYHVEDLVASRTSVRVSHPRPRRPPPASNMDLDLGLRPVHSGGRAQQAAGAYATALDHHATLSRPLILGAAAPALWDRGSRQTAEGSGQAAKGGALGNGRRDGTSYKNASPGIPPLPPRVMLSRASCATPEAHRPASPAGAMATSAPTHRSASQLTLGVHQSLHAGTGSGFTQQCPEARRSVVYSRGIVSEARGSARVGRGPSPPPHPSPFVAMVQAMSVAKAALESSGGGAAAVRVKTGGGGLSAGIPRDLRGRDGGGETTSGPELHWAGQM